MMILCMKCINERLPTSQKAISRASVTVISSFLGASPFFVDVFVDTLIKEKCLFSGPYQFHIKKMTLPHGR